MWQYKELNDGVPFDPPKETKSKKAAAPAPAPVAGGAEGPSKKQLNKEKKKAAKNAAKGRVQEGGNARAPNCGCVGDYKLCLIDCGC